MDSPETPLTAPVRPAARRKRAVLAGGALALVIAVGAVLTAAPAEAARGYIDSNGNCHSQPAAAKTSTVQAQRLLKTEPITLTVKASVDANCNLTYTVSAPDKGRAVKSWALSNSESYPGGMAGQQKSNEMSQASLTATDTISIKDQVALAADDKMSLRVYVEYDKTATEGVEYYRYTVDVPVY